MDQLSVDRFNKRIKETLPNRCTNTGDRCVYRTSPNRRQEEIDRQPYVFIARPYSKDCNDMEDACKNVIDLNWIIASNADSGITLPHNSNNAVITAKELGYIGNGYCQICSLIQYSFFGITELAHLNPNVMLEIGLMNAFSKPIIITIDKRLTNMSDIPFDLSGLLVVPYEGYTELKDGLSSKFVVVKALLENLGLL